MPQDKARQVRNYLNENDSLKGWVAKYERQSSSHSYIVDNCYMNGVLFVVEVDPTSTDTKKVTEAYNVEVFTVVPMKESFQVSGVDWVLTLTKPLPDGPQS